MNSVARLRIVAAGYLASIVGCTYAGAKLYKKRPVVGGAIGFIVVSPIVNYGIKRLIAPNDSFASLAASDPLPIDPGITREVPKEAIPSSPGINAPNDFVKPKGVESLNYGNATPIANHSEPIPLFSPIMVFRDNARSNDVASGVGTVYQDTPTVQRANAVASHGDGTIAV